MITGCRVFSRKSSLFRIALLFYRSECQPGIRMGRLPAGLRMKGDREGG